MRIVWISEQTVAFALYMINRLVFRTEVECVYCVVRTESLYNTDKRFELSLSPCGYSGDFQYLMVYFINIFLCEILGYRRGVNGVFVFPC